MYLNCFTCSTGKERRKKSELTIQVKLDHLPTFVMLQNAMTKVRK